LKIVDVVDVQDETQEHTSATNGGYTDGDRVLRATR
jgi:hypothetical protein